MRYLHTMVRVKDLDASLRFYCEGLGLTEMPTGWRTRRGASPWCSWPRRKTSNWPRSARRRWSS